jgi:sugar phosphate isomerase/epimerase
VKELSPVQPLEIGICSWSVDRHDPIRAIRAIAGDLDVRAVQIGFFGEQAVRQARADDIRAAVKGTGVELSGAFVGFDGEDYSSPTAIGQSGGLVPDDVFEHRLSVLAGAAALTGSLGLHTLAAHLGAIPGDRNDSRHAVMLHRVRRAADACAEHQVTLLAETGAEPPGDLRDFIAAVDRENLALNFDTGNFVAYGTGDPVSAVSILGDLIHHVHMKDSTASPAPGVQWGSNAPLGTGDANIPRVISKLRARAYAGPLTIENKAGGGSLDPIRDDIAYLRTMFD